MEDPDAKTPKPYVHWVLYNVPPETDPAPGMCPDAPSTEGAERRASGTKLTRAGRVRRTTPSGRRSGAPLPQLFALDTMLDVPPGADRDAVLKALTGHVIARGEVIGTFRRSR